MRTGTRLLFSGLLLLALLAPAAARADGATNCFPFHILGVNRVYDPAPPDWQLHPSNSTPNLVAYLTNFNTVAFFGGGFLTNDSGPHWPGTITNAPTDGSNRLVRCVIGQPVGGVDFLTVGDTFYFGEPIIADGALGVDYTRQPAQWEPTNAMAFIAGPNRAYGTAPGFVKIWWYRPDGSTNSPVSYYVRSTANPTNPAVALYHTHVGQIAGERCPGYQGSHRRCVGSPDDYRPLE